jgi:arylamine N-acetyltransferase
MKEEELRLYLDRIGLDAALPPPTLETLARVTWAHIATFPFENLFILNDDQDLWPDPDPAAAFQKLVLRQRGGYCYEQNAVLSSALRALGFQVFNGAARVVVSNDGVTSTTEKKEKDGNKDGDAPAAGLSHRIMFVCLDGATYLIDAGFGANALPLPLRLPDGCDAYESPGDDYDAAAPYAGRQWAADLPLASLSCYSLRLGLSGSSKVPFPGTTLRFQHRAGYYLLRRLPWLPSGDHEPAPWDEGLKPLYFFRLDEHQPSDYAMGNFYNSRHPGTFFVDNIVAARQTATGRVVVSGLARFFLNT